MTKNRIAMSVVLTAGLGLSGLVAASSSGAATPEPAKAPVSARAGAKAARVQALTKVKPGKGGRIIACFVGRKPGVPGLPGLPGFPGAPGTPPGTMVPLPAGPGAKAGGHGERMTVRIVNGTVYVNGKKVSGKKPPKGRMPVNCSVKFPGSFPGNLPGKPVKGGPGAGQVIIESGPGGVSVKGATGGSESGTTTSRLDG